MYVVNVIKKRKKNLMYYHVLKTYLSILFDKKNNRRDVPVMIFKEMWMHYLYIRD